MAKVRIIIIQENNLWGVISGGKFTKIFYRGKNNGRWKWVRVKAGYFFLAGNIINEHGR